MKKMKILTSNFVEGLKFQIDLLNRHHTHRRFALFMVCIATSFLLFFIRNPDPFINPVFYAEDGSSYVNSILNRGFWFALFHARPDYYVFGNVILTGIALKINNIFYPGSILYLPQNIALISYLFYALVATLPIVLFTDKIKITYLITLALIASFFPLHSADFEVIGRICNVGYAFVYIAFLLIAYRLFCLKNTRLFILIDLLILICALTNPVVYLMLPAIYLPHLKDYWVNKVPINSLLKNPSLISAFVLGNFIVLLFVFKILIVSPTLSPPKGHLDSSFVFSNAIEMFIARSMLYPAIYPIYKRMNDISVILILTFIFISFLKFSRKQNYGLYIFGFYSLVVFTLAAAIFRPGLSGMLNNYSSTFPDRYYYGQNLLATFLIVVLFQDISSRLKTSFRRKAWLAIMLAVFLAGWQDVSTYGHPADPLRELGNFEQTLVATLKERRFPDTTQFIELPIYPPPWKMTISKELAEKSVAQGKLIKALNVCQ